MTISPSFWNKRDTVSMARSLRLAMVVNQYDIGNLDEDQAKELLTGPLSPGDDSIHYDDSQYLEWKPDSAALNEAREVLR